MYVPKNFWILQSAKRNCKQEYIDVEISNRKCAMDLQTISEVEKKMNLFLIGIFFEFMKALFLFTRPD